MSRDQSLAEAGSQTKLTLLFGAFLTLILALGALLLSGISRDLRFVEQERRGVALITTIRPLLEYLPQHRGLCNAYLHGDTAFRSRCLDAGQSVDLAFAELAQISAPGIRGEVNALHARWLRLREQTFTMPPEAAFAEHSRLIAEVIALLREVAEAFNLLLDPAMGSHELINIVVSHLPTHTDTIGELRGLGSGIAAQGPLTGEARIGLAVLNEQVGRTNAQLPYAIHEIGKQNSAVASVLGAPVENLVRQTRAFQEMVSAQLLNGGDDKVTAGQFFDAGSRAIEAGFKLYDLTLAQLDTLLAERASHSRRDLYLSIVMLVLISLLALFLLTRLSRSLRRLELSEGRLSSVFDTIVDGLIVTDEQGRIRSFNPTAEGIFGYSASEVIGQNVTRLMPEVFRHHHDGYMRRFLEANEKRIIGSGGEIPGLRKDGTIFPMELAVSSASTGSQRIVTCVVRDISARKHADATLARQHNLIETIGRAQTRFIASGNPFEFFEGMLPDLLTLTGSAFGFIAEVMQDREGNPYLKLYAQTNIAWDKASRAYYQQHIAQGLEFHNLNTLFGHVILTGAAVISNDPAHDPRSSGTPNGHPPLTAFLGIPIHRGGQLTGMIGLANRPQGYDESVIELLQPIVNTCAQLLDALGKERQRLRTAQQLKRANNFMSALIGNIQAGILVEDEAGGIYEVNETYCDLFGKKQRPATIAGGDCQQEFERKRALFADPAGFLRHRQLCLKERHVVTGKELALNDGRVFEQDYVPVVVEDEQGAIHHCHLWSYRDISEHQRVLKNLSQAKEAAEVAARAKSQFLATMSHEIRTPMNGVLGMLYLLGKTELNERQRRFLETAAGSGEMLLTVINDILDFSKLDAGKLELESIPFDPVALVEETAALMAKGAHEKGLELICAVAQGVPRWSRGDPTRLRQVLTNLLSNAIKFTEKGEVVVNVSPLEHGIHFGVRDTGIGIPDEEQKYLFQAFSQVDSSHTRKYGGTGLGLAICQRLVAAMGGEIRVGSVLGQGSKFSFNLPLAAVKDVAQRQRLSALLPQQRILVVDDNATNRMVLKNILESWQVMKNDVAGGAAEALAQLRSAAAAGQPYAIALLDMQMPVMDGLQLARAIRADVALRGMTLVMLSSVDRDTAVPELDAWLTKPVRQSDLYNTLMALLGERTTDDETVTPAREDGWWFGGRTLLLAEDNQVNQQVAQEILSAAGFAIDTCDNGAAAVQAVQEKRYDAVLMDVQMPLLDGIAATQEIRALGGPHATLPIIAMTAHALSGDAEKSAAAGMNGHVTKPVDPEALFTTLARWIVPGEKPATVTAPTAAAAMAGRPSLPGIDVADGLQRLRGNWASYQRILQGFRDRQAGAAAAIAAHIDRGELEAAARLAHAIKGSSGNIGAKELYQSAGAMEQHCRNGDVAAARAGVGTLCATLALVIDGLACLDDNGG